MNAPAGGAPAGRGPDSAKAIDVRPLVLIRHLIRDPGRQQAIVVHHDLGIGEVPELAQLDGGELDLLGAAAISTRTSRTVLDRRPSRTASGMFRVTISSAVRASIWATSRATFRHRRPRRPRRPAGAVSRGWDGRIPADDGRPSRCCPAGLHPGSRAACPWRSRTRARPRCSARAAPGAHLARPVADRDAAEEADLAGAEGPGQHADDRLHLHVVRGDAIEDQPVRSGQASRTSTPTAISEAASAAAAYSRTGPRPPSPPRDALSSCRLLAVGVEPDPALCDRSRSTPRSGRRRGGLPGGAARKVRR